MASIDLIRASNGSGNASAATVQSIRSPAATTLDVDTVQGINDTFCATMGTPHTFTDPITSETITVISEATAVDFTGHVDGTNLEIDTIAPGYTDAGSVVGDIIIIRPTTQWSDNVADVLDVSLNDDGTLKAVTENPGYTALAYTPNTVVANGNRSYTLTFNSVDLTGALSAGMRLRTTRTSAAPTQCTSLNGTTQYWVKTSPNKLTFTDDFVVSAWIKLSSYAQVTIASRFNATSGWMMQVSSTGQVNLQGFNGGIGNVSYVQSYQSIPLNKWVHVTAQLDMSAFTATSTTSYVMIDGVDVPASVARTGTNPTALVQAGNLEIGSYNGGTNLFPGKIAQVAIYNAKVTQANIRATISQGLTGSETSLASAYSFNNSTTDLNTSTPNDLSAGAGSPTATNADSPFGGQADGTISSTLDYAEIRSVTFSTNTTIVVSVPDGNTIPTTGGVSAVSYSTQASPYGCTIPAAGLNELAITEVKAAQSFTTETDALGHTFTITPPTGNRKIRLTMWVRGFASTVSNDNIELRIKEGSTTLAGSAAVAAGTAGNGVQGVHVVAEFTPTTGAHTYKVTYNRSAGAGTSQTLASESGSQSAVFKAELVN